MKKKIAGLITCVIFLAPILPITVSAKAEPELEINLIGKLGIEVIITNNGNDTANNVQCSLQVNGGLLGQINKTGLGTISSLPAGSNDVGVKVYLFGLGQITITAIVEASNVPRVEKTVNGLVILFFVIIFE